MDEGKFVEVNKPSYIEPQKDDPNYEWNFCLETLYKALQVTCTYSSQNPSFDKEINEREPFKVNIEITNVGADSPFGDLVFTKLTVNIQQGVGLGPPVHEGRRMVFPLFAEILNGGGFHIRKDLGTGMKTSFDLDLKARLSRERILEDGLKKAISDAEIEIPELLQVGKMLVLPTPTDEINLEEVAFVKISAISNIFQPHIPTDKEGYVIVDVKRT